MTAKELDAIVSRLDSARQHRKRENGMLIDTALENGQSVGERVHALTMDELMKGPHLFMGEWRHD